MRSKRNRVEAKVCTVCASLMSTHWRRLDKRVKAVFRVKRRYSVSFYVQAYVETPVALQLRVVGQQTMRSIREEVNK